MKEEPYNVQLQILNAAVKTFLKTQTEESYNILNQVFEFTSKESDNPDLRERGFMYWRLMAIDPNLAAQIVLTDKPRISEDISGYDPSLLDVLVSNIGSLASIYVKPPELFVKKGRKENLGEEEETDYEENAINIAEQEEVVDKKKESKSKKREETEKEFQPKSGMNLLDLNDILSGTVTSNITNNNSNKNNNLEIIGVFQSTNSIDHSLLQNVNSMSIRSKREAVIPKQNVLNENTSGYTNKNYGLSIDAALQREDGNLTLYMTFTNKTNTQIQDFEIQFNKNFFGLSAYPNCLRGLILRPGIQETKSIDVILNQPDSSKVPSYDPPVTLQTAIRCSLDEFYFTIPVMFSVLFEPISNHITLEEYQKLFINGQSPKDLFLTLNNVNTNFQNEISVNLF